MEFKLDFLKIIKSGLGVVFSAAFGIVLVKLIAVYQGPSGLGEFGVYRQFVQFIGAFLACGNGFAVIEGYSKAEDKNAFLRQCQGYFWLVLIATSLPVAIFSSQFSVWLYDSANFSSWFLASPVLFFFMTIYFFFRYAVAARGEIGLASLLQGLPFFLMSAAIFATRDTFYIFLGGYAVAAVVGFLLFKGKGALRPFSDFRRMRGFEKTAFATLLTSAVGFFALLVVKSFCNHFLGLHDTGLIESNLNLVNYATLIFLTALSLYYMPAIAKDPKDEHFRQKMFRFNTYVAAATLAVLILGQHFFVRLLFSDEFTSTGHVFHYFAAGEFLKCINWFFIFSMIGLSFKKQYVVFDTVMNAVFIAATFLLLSFSPSIASVGLGYLLFQAGYFLLNCYFNFKHRILPQKTLYGCLAISCLPIIIAILIQKA